VKVFPKQQVLSVLRKASGGLAVGLMIAAMMGWMLLGSPARSNTPVEYHGPRSAYGDGHPDLSGIWQTLSTADWDLEAHLAAPGHFWQEGALGAQPAGLSVVEGKVIPYRPEALAQKKANFENRFTADPYKLELGDPEFKCFSAGVPRSNYLPHPFQILQTPRYVLFAYQYANTNRVVRMGGHTEAPVDSWMGWSNGHWEGETLVVDVTGFLGTEGWLDRAGNYTSDALHVTERFRLIDHDHLDYEATIDDPKVFTRPWKIHLPLDRRIEPNMHIIESKCQEFAEEALYGKLSKPGHDPAQVNPAAITR
jgi:hypothetical protein